MTTRAKILSTVSFLAAAVLSAFIAGGSATIIEKRSKLITTVALEAAGQGWVDVQTDGLQVILLGTAPSEAVRFRAITLAGTVVDASRIVDNTGVENNSPTAAPAFSLQMLRNDDGLSLIGLIPAGTDRTALVAGLRDALEGGTLTDMLETADYPEPPGWSRALDFAITTIKSMPRAKLSVNPGAVSVEAITDSTTEKTRIETTLARRRPADLKLVTDISAPRPVITPFTLRFLIDAEGPRFDACSADTERARERILAAARTAGVTGAQGCTIGMGTPSPLWADAVTMGLKALADLGAGTITFSDADIVLSAGPDVPADQFDKVVGELDSNLPEVFSLRAERQQKPEQMNPQSPEFSALLAKDGHLELRGRLGDERARDAVESFARARFGAQAVYGATRLDAALPPGWSVRSMAALEALDTLAQGAVTVTPDLVRISGLTGDPQASDTISRLLTQRLGEGAQIALNVRYDRRLDPVLGLPTGPECLDRLNGVLAEHKISFEPGSAVISAAGAQPVEALVAAMKDCQDFRMEITGHTDSQGRDEMNLALSEDRAQSVLRALTERGVATDYLTAKGYGETQPIADNETEQGREANRRIEFVLLDATPVGVAAPQNAAAVPAPGAASPQTGATAPDAAVPAESAAATDAPAHTAEDMPAASGTQPAPVLPSDDLPSDDLPAEAAGEHAPPMDAPMDGPMEGPMDGPGASDTAAPAGSAETAPAEAGTAEAGTAADGASADSASQAAPEDMQQVVPVAPADQSPARPVLRPQEIAPPEVSGAADGTSPPAAAGDSPAAAVTEPAAESPAGSVSSTEPATAVTAPAPAEPPPGADAAPADTGADTAPVAAPATAAQGSTSLQTEATDPVAPAGTETTAGPIAPPAAAPATPPAGPAQTGPAAPAAGP